MNPRVSPFWNLSHYELAVGRWTCRGCGSVTHTSMLYAVYHDPLTPSSIITRAVDDTAELFDLPIKLHGGKVGERSPPVCAECYAEAPKEPRLPPPHPDDPRAVINPRAGQLDIRDIEIPGKGGKTIVKRINRQQYAKRLGAARTSRPSASLDDILNAL